MLKRRIIPVQLLVDGRLVKTRQFGAYRDVGDPVASSRVYSAQNADELVFLNIHRTSRTIDPLLPLLERVSEVCFMPLALGGGVASLKDAEILIRHGADKVVVNSVLYREPGLARAIADKFGSQAVVASIDVRREGDDWALFSDCGRRREPITLLDHVARLIEEGAGEILLNSIDRDGTMSGYDVPLIKRVVAASSIPIIACGGAGDYEHMREAFIDAGAQELACGSLFNFGDNNPIRAKAHLTTYGLPFKV